MSSNPSAVTLQLDRVISIHGDSPAYRFKEQTVSYAELGRQVRRCAGGLAELGVATGDRVGVMLRNRMEFFVLSQAIWRAGAVMVPLNVLLSAFEAGHVVRDSGMRVLVVNGDLADRAREAVPRPGTEVRIVVLDDDADADVDADAGAAELGGSALARG